MDHIVFALDGRHTLTPTQVLNQLVKERDSESPRFQKERYERFIELYDRRAVAAGWIRQGSRYVKAPIVMPDFKRRDRIVTQPAKRR